MQVKNTINGEWKVNEKDGSTEKDGNFIYPEKNEEGINMDWQRKLN